MNHWTTAASVFAILLAVVGLYIAFRNWLFWTRGDIKNLRARVFLDENFLISNFNLILLIGGVLGVHVIVMLFEAMEINSSRYLVMANYLLMDLAMFLMVVLAFLWFRLFSKGGKLQSKDSR